jgi:hypothetical protein
MREDDEDNGPVVLLASHLPAGPSCPVLSAKAETGAGAYGDASAGAKRSNGVAWFQYVGTVAKTRLS